MPTPIRRLLAVVALTVSLAACNPPAPPDAAVVAGGFRFQPQTLEVPAGTTITWRNADAVNHSATAGLPGEPGGPFDIQLAQAGTSGRHHFDQAGTYPYFCTFHESMTGEVVVTDS